MKFLAIALITICGFAYDAVTLGAGVKFLIIDGYSAWWWILVLANSCGVTVWTYKAINAVNGYRAEWK